MSARVLEGSARIDYLKWDPFKLFIVGIDARPDGTIDGPEHPRYDPRVKLPIDPDMVASILKYRRNLQPITVSKVGEIAEVDDGRQRVRAAREAQRLLREQGSDVQIVVHSGLAMTGFTAADSVIMGLELNSLRRNDDDMTRVEKACLALRYADDPDASKTAIARACGWTHPSRVDDAIIINERATAEVKDLLRRGLITMPAAVEMAAKKPEAQVKRAEIILAKAGPEAEAPAITTETVVMPEAKGKGKAKSPKAAKPVSRRELRAIDAEAEGRDVKVAVMPRRKQISTLVAALAKVGGGYDDAEIAASFLAGAIFGAGLDLPDALTDEQRQAIIDAQAVLDRVLK